MAVYDFIVNFKDRLTNPMQRMAASGVASYNKLNNGQKKFNTSIDNSNIKVQKFSSSGITAYNKLNTGQRKLNTSIDNGHAKVNSLSSSMLSMAGRFLTVAGGIAVAKDSLNKWDEQVQSEAQVMQGIKSTNGIAGKSFEDLARSASKLQENSLFGDEGILKNVSAQMLTFTNITGKTFDRVEQSVLDVTTRLYGANASSESLRSTSIMLGKALNDPVANLGALSRSGIQFSEAQKTMIKNMWNAGQQAQAQGLILTELEKQYGGSAKAAAQAGLGPWKQFMNSVGDIQEKLGPPLMTLVNSFMEMFHWVERNAFVIGLFTAGIAGAVVGYYAWIAVTKLQVAWLAIQKTAMFTSILLTEGWTAAQTALNIAMNLNPIGLIVAGVAALTAGFIYAWNTSEKFRGTILGVWEVMKGFGNIIKDYVIARFKGLLSGFGALGSAIGALFKGKWGKAKDLALKGLKDLSGTDAKNAAWESAKGLGEKFNEGFQKGKDTKKISNPFASITAQSNAQKQNPAASGVLALTAGESKKNKESLADNPTVKTGIQGITGGGQRNNNVSIKLDNLIETLNINSSTISESVEEMRDKVTEALLRVLNSSNKVSFQQ